MPGLIAATLVLALPAAVAGDEIVHTRERLEQSHRAALETLAVWCDEQGLTSEAERTRAWARPRDPRRLTLVILPRGPGEEVPDDDAPAEMRRWHEQFMTLRRSQADALFDLARTSLRQNRASLAFELVLEAVRENPDHDGGRRLLGYQRFRDEWRTPYEIRKLRSGQVWHDRFGWLPRKHVERYEAGERLVGSRWMSAEEEAELRSRIEQGWLIETEHYEVLTNHSLEAGVQLGIHLEELYRAWQQTFAGYYSNAAQLASLFEGRGIARRNAPRHRVVYFRNRDDYQEALRSELPPGIETTGYYWGDRRTAYFFADDEHDRTTLYHEATHQLFSESRPVVRDIGRQANFWVVEGIACYMESLQEQNGYHTLGGADAVRFRDARYRLLQSDFYVPLAQLASKGMGQLQKDPSLPMLYSQAAGLTHFLMHYDNGRYRDALIAYLVAVYTGRDHPATLMQLTGASFAELDRQYRQFVETAP